VLVLVNERSERDLISGMKYAEELSTERNMMPVRCYVALVLTVSSYRPGSADLTAESVAY
jgi:hypothetical protein